jgi:ATP/ADP translocase
MFSDNRIRLLGTQTLLLGLLAGFLIVPASGLFLHTYGSKNLPWVYLSTAISGLLCTFGLIGALRRWSIAFVGTLFYSVITCLVFGSWLQLVTVHQAWVSAPLFALFPTTFQIGFVLIGGQAGRVFNLAEMKASFGKVVAGFPLGFVIAGLLATVAIPRLHGSTHLLVLSAISTVSLVAMFWKTTRAFPTLSKVSSSTAAVTPRASVTATPVRNLRRSNNTSDINNTSGTNEVTTGKPSKPQNPIFRILGDQFVRTLLGYQTLIFAQSQLVEFLIFDRAANRYRAADELATFVSSFQALMNTSTLVFVLFASGWLFRRFGMRYGAIANPIVVTTLLIGVLFIGKRTNFSSLLILSLVGAARISSITLTNGATRASLNTSLQALPANDRLAAQALIEGVGIPVATGLCGLVLLISRNHLHLSAEGFVALAILLGIGAVICGRVLISRYASSLRNGLQQRILKPTWLNLDDPHTLELVQQFLSSNDEASIGLGIASTQNHSVLTNHLENIAVSGRGIVSAQALTRLFEIEPQLGTSAALSILERGRSATFHFVGPSVEQVAAAGIISTQSSFGELNGAIRATITAGFGFSNPAELGITYRASIQTGDPALVSHVVRAVADSNTSATATTALQLHQPAIALIVETVLASQTMGKFGGSGSLVRLVRALACDPSWNATLLLVQLLQHRSSEVGAAALATLAQRPSGALSACRESVQTLFISDATQALQILDLLQRIPEEESARLLRRSLHDELEIFARKTQSYLKILFGQSVIDAIVLELSRDDARLKVHAIETLEMSSFAKTSRVDQRPPDQNNDLIEANGNARIASALLSNHRSERERAAILRRHLPQRASVLSIQELADDNDRIWRRPWLSVAAQAYLPT